MLVSDERFELPLFFTPNEVRLLYQATQYRVFMAVCTVTLPFFISDSDMCVYEHLQTNLVASHHGNAPCPVVLETKMQLLHL